MHPEMAFIESGVSHNLLEELENPQGRQGPHKKHRNYRWQVAKRDSLMQVVRAHIRTRLIWTLSHLR